MLEQIGWYAALAALIVAIPLGIGLLLSLGKRTRIERFTDFPRWLQFTAGLFVLLAVVVVSVIITGFLFP